MLHRMNAPPAHRLRIGQVAPRNLLVLHKRGARLRPYHQLYTVRRICPLCPHPLCLPALPRLQDPIGHEEHTRGDCCQYHNSACVYLSSSCTSPPSLPPFSCKTCDGSACKSKSCTRSPCSSLRARSSGVRSSLPLIPAGTRQC